ncbi:MAG: hypothetical protein LBT73_03720 [Tannerellaceae bacterium]|jgi:hypothetical protein|nr:hypothetical protein [Tannerellaceae bacterium]
MKRCIKWLAVPAGVFFFVATGAAQYYLGNSVVYAPVDGKDPALFYGNNYVTLFLHGQADHKISILNIGYRVQAAYHSLNLGAIGWDFNRDTIFPEAPFVIEPIYDAAQHIDYYHVQGTPRPNGDNTPSAVALRFDANSGLNLSGITQKKEEYVLHMELRVHESEDFVVLLSDGTQLWYVPIQNRGRQGAVPNLNGKYAFPADAEWYCVDIELTDFRPADLQNYEQTPSFNLFTNLITDTVAIVAIAAGQTNKWRIGGVNENLNIDIGTVFFYRKIDEFTLKYTEYSEGVWDRPKAVPLNYILESVLTPEGSPEGTWWKNPIIDDKFLISKLEWVPSQPHKVTIDKEQNTLVFHPFFAGKTDVIIRTGFTGIEDTCQLHVWGLLAKLKNERGEDLLFPLINPLDTINVRLDYLADGKEVVPWDIVSLPDGLELLSFEDGWAKIKTVELGTFEVIGKIPFEEKDSSVSYPIYVSTVTPPATTTVGVNASFRLPAPGINIDRPSDPFNYLSDDYLKDPDNWEWTALVNFDASITRQGVLSGDRIGLLPGITASLKGSILSTPPFDFYVVTVDSLTPVSGRMSPRRGRLGTNTPFTLHYTAYENKQFPIIWKSEDDSIRVNSYGTITIIGSTRGDKPVVAYLDGNETLRAEGFITYWPHADSVVIQTPLDVNLTLSNEPYAMVAGAEVWPEYTTNNKVHWESLHPDTVEVNPSTGAVRPLRKGTALIRVVAEAAGLDGEQRADTFSVNISFPEKFALQIEQSSTPDKKADTVYIRAGVEERFHADADSFVLHQGDVTWSILRDNTVTDKAEIIQTDEGCTLKASLESTETSDTLTLWVTIEGRLEVARCVLIVSPNTQIIDCPPHSALSIDVVFREVFTPLGRRVAVFTVTDNDLMLPLSLPEGIYLLRDIGKDGRHVVTKFKGGSRQ